MRLNIYFLVSPQHCNLSFFFLFILSYRKTFKHFDCFVINLSPLLCCFIILFLLTVVHHSLLFSLFYFVKFSLVHIRFFLHFLFPFSVYSLYIFHEHIFNFFSFFFFLGIICYFYLTFYLYITYIYIYKLSIQ